MAWTVGEAAKLAKVRSGRCTTTTRSACSNRATTVRPATGSMAVGDLERLQQIMLFRESGRAAGDPGDHPRPGFDRTEALKAQRNLLSRRLGERTPPSRRSTCS